MSAHIQITALDGQLLQERRIEQFPCRVGRAPLNDIVIDDETVSSEHATLELDGERLVLVDKGSSNGIIFNRERVPRVEGLHIDCILGQVRFNARMEGAGLEKTRVIDLAELLGRLATQEIESQPVPEPPGHAGTPLALNLGLIGGAIALHGFGSFLDGRSDLLKMSSELISYLFASAAIAGVLSLFRKLVSKQFHYWDFLALVFGLAVVDDFAVTAISVLGYAFDEQTLLLGPIPRAMNIVIGGAALYLVIKRIHPSFMISRRVLAILGALGVLSAVSWGLKEKRSERLIRYPIAANESLSLTIHRELRSFTPEERGRDHLMRRLDSTFKRAEESVRSLKEKQGS